MKPRLFISFLVLGAAALVTRQLRREKITYPPASSLVIDLQTELLPREDGLTERIIKLEGAANLRDLGGYKTADGRYVRWGRVYRSGMLANITEADRQILQTLGLKWVCDLRSDEEVRDNPETLPAGMHYQRIPINTDRPSDVQRRLRVLMLDKKNIGKLVEEIYRRAIDESAGVFGEVLRQVANPDNLPLLFHCSAGKDRAGLTAALLLLALGVPEDVVIADYSLSNHYYDDFQHFSENTLKRLARFGVTENDLFPMLTVNPQTLKMALDYLHERYGSIADYLRNQVGISDKTLEQIKANLLT